MTDISIDNSLALADQHLQARRFAEAESVCRNILQTSPEEPRAYRLLGIVAYHTNNFSRAVDFFEKSISLDPNITETYNNLGNALKNLDRRDEAIAAYRRALALQPNLAGVENNLGNVLQDQGQLEEAIGAYRRALTIQPGYAFAGYNLGNALVAMNRWEEAIEAYRRVLLIQPNYAKAHFNLGFVLQSRGRWEEAIHAFQQVLLIKPGFVQAQSNIGNIYQSQGRLDEAVTAHRKALAIQPDQAGIWNNLGNVLKALGRPEEAVSAYRSALEIQPTMVEAENNLGITLKTQGKLDESVAALRRALAIQPNLAEVENNLGTSLKLQGRLDEAIEAIERALALRPTYTEAHSNLLLSHQYNPTTTIADLADVHREWDQRHAAPLKTTWQPLTNDKNPDRRLRLGFVSGDFCRHAVSYFFIRFIESLDSKICETVCYSNRVLKDEFTARIETASGAWRDVVRLSDEELADRIREDGIDILFDLAGHTRSARLLVFARKPAPIQLTWIGYVGTTGLTAIDYLIADRILIPKGKEVHYSEKILRLPDGHVCFEPPSDAPTVGPLPAISQGHVTFGSFNNPAKVGPEVVAIWAKILRRVSEAKMVLRFNGFEDEGNKRRFSESFAAHDVDPSRLQLYGMVPHREMMDHYNRIDIALDPFPFTGGATTCNALWMGVPVITLPGETFVSRQSFSHLSNVGMTETIAKDKADYVNLAVELAQDLPRLSELRAGLRERVASSPLCNGKLFADNLMKTLRVAWCEWCKDPIANE